MKTPRYPCLCAAIRKAGRVLTRRYDHSLKPSGLRATQFSMLNNIARNPGITVSGLAGLLEMDQTTVTRNLRVLEKAGHVRLEMEATDQRIRRTRISDTGMAKLVEARLLWESAQQEMEETLGTEDVESLLGILRKMTN